MRLLVGQHVLAEVREQACEPLVDLRELGFVAGIQFCTATYEILVTVLHQALLRGGQLLGLVTFINSRDASKELGILGDAVFIFRQLRRDHTFNIWKWPYI